MKFVPRIKNRIFPPAPAGVLLASIGLLSSVVASVFAKDASSPPPPTVPAASMTIRIPPSLAQRIARESLGEPLANRDSRVTIRVPLVNPRVRNIRLRKAPEVVKVYGQNLFGIRFDEPFGLGVRIFDMEISGDVRLQSLRFREFSGADHEETGKNPGEEIDVDVAMELRRISVKSPKIWIKELGLTPPQTRSAGQGCPTPIKPIVEFSGQHVWAEVRDARVDPKSEKLGERPIRVKARFRVSKREGARTGESPEENPEENPENSELAIEPIFIDHNAAEVLNPGYRLRVRNLEVPKVWIKIDGECFEGDRSGIEAFFDSMLEKIKREIVKGVSKQLSTVVMKESAKALRKLTIPTGKRFEANRTRWIDGFRPEIPAAPADHTRVAKQKLLSVDSTIPDDPGTSTTAPEKQAHANAVMAIFEGLLWEIRETLWLHSLHAAPDGSLVAGLTDRLELNGHSEQAVEPTAIGALLSPRDDVIRAVIGPTFFDAKIDLLRSLRAEQLHLLPPNIRRGIRWGANGIEVRGRPDRRLSLIAHLEVELSRLEGIASAVAAIEKYTGNTDGIYRVPIQLNLAPEVVTVDGSRKLRIRATLRNDLLETEFRQRSNLDGASKIITWALKRKFTEIATNLARKPIDVDLAPFETKSPFRVEQVFFAGSGALVTDVSVGNVRPFIPRKPKAGRK